jgi:hypothetical protein
LIVTSVVAATDGGDGRLRDLIPGRVFATYGRLIVIFLSVVRRI